MHTKSSIAESTAQYLDREESYQLWWVHRQDSDKRGGVGILANEDLVQDVVEIQRITPRIIKT